MANIKIDTSIDILSIPSILTHNYENHSRIVDSNFSPLNVDSGETTQIIRSYGKFQTYPEGIFNLAFCDMMLWEIAPNHILNDYKISQFHQIKSGVIMYGHNAYVFTPILNNDIQSYLKILLREKPLKHNLPASKAAKRLVTYIREKSKNHIIPCTPTIQAHLHHMLGITEHTYIGDESTYLTLLY